ncbi:hypothetical protein [Stenotrophomonas maltophilia]|uniref:hypothetical protein n=1 Tax=Stenotrophomonas maltophilia TaxID=40324 RepID=UPI0039C0DEEA
MWTSTAPKDLKASFDNAISSAYGNGSNDELSNLAKLFSDAAMRNYERGLNNALDEDSAASVGLAWIDKRPIAKLTADGPGAELGDMLLIVEEFDPQGRVSTRACIVEVKQSPSSTIPPVPVTPGSESTKNQFKILSEWPTIHGVRATGSNNSYLLENVVTQPGPKDGGVLTQAWYAAVRPKSAGAANPYPWMVAPAIRGADFNYTLGDLFAACAIKQSLRGPDSRPIGVGREVDLEEVRAQPGWSELIETIIVVARRYHLPPKYFDNKKTNRYRQTYINARDHAFLMLAMPAPGSVLNIALGTATGIVLAAITLAIAFWLVQVANDARISARAARKEIAHQDKSEGDADERKFPVIYFSIFHGEKYDQQVFGDG